MATIQHILAGLDEQRLADRAVVAALHLARILHVPMQVVHAIQARAERPWFAGDEALAKARADLEHAARADRLEHLMGLLQPLAATPQEIEAMLVVEPGRSAHVLATRAAEVDGGLLVLGGHRHRGVLDFGGTARELMSHPPCALWVQSSREWHSPKRVLVSVDLSPGSGVVLAAARQLAAGVGAELTLFHCFEPPAFSYQVESRLGHVIERLRSRERAEFDEFLASVQDGVPALQVDFAEGDATSMILERLADHDVLVLGTHAHGALGRALLGSHAYRILKEATVPVMVVPQPNVSY
ncbi:MAG: universal stress protein [Planctomycetes bacterium]|nr:universal stress protein [Planctomycetota bacterium]MCB9871467.1 universal stress protein [Planctomycetota bacterium]